MNGGGAVVDVVLWATSVHDDPRPFSKRGVFFYGGEGIVGSSNLLGS